MILMLWRFQGLWSCRKSFILSPPSIIILIWGRWGPSRTILHGRGVGSKSRIRVRRPPGSSGALWTCKKVKALRGHANFGLLRDPLFLGPRMRSVSSFRKVACFWEKREPVKKSMLISNTPISASSGTLSFWHRVCVLSRLLEKLHAFGKKREPVKKSMLIGNTPISASSGTLSFWHRVCVLSRLLEKLHAFGKKNVNL